MTAGDLLMMLTLIEANAKMAREQLANSLMASSQPDPILMPGQPIPKVTNKQAGALIMQQHHASMARLGTAVNAVFGRDDGGGGGGNSGDGERDPNHPPGLNGDAGTIASQAGQLREQRVSDSIDSIGHIAGRIGERVNGKAH